MNASKKSLQDVNVNKNYDKMWKENKSGWSRLYCFLLLNEEKMAGDGD